MSIILLCYTTKIVQIESKNNKLACMFCRDAALRSLKSLKSLKSSLPLKKNKSGRKLSLPPACSVFKKRLFHDNFLNNIVGTHDVETCCHAGAGVSAYQCAGCCVDCYALCAVNNNLAVCSCDNHACYVNICNA